jgi:TetR/AcrR family fatty acid metabolism transcriptional regulator
MAGKDEITTKVVIINCALRLFKEHGYKNVTIKDICETANISRGTFYYYFKSKEEIFDNYFLKSELAITENLLNILDSKNHINQFRIIFDTFLTQIIEEGPEIMAQIYKRNLDSEIKQLAPCESSMWDIYVKVLKNAQEAGEIMNKISIEDLLESYLYMSVGITFVWCNKNGKFDLVEEHHRLFNRLFQIKEGELN